MKLFVTGASGFIGQAFCEAHKRDTIAVYNSATGGNLCDPLRLTEELERAQPDWVIHLAAHANVRRGPDEPSRDFEVNTRGTFNLLEAMRHAGCRRIMFASSCSVYGEPTMFPTPEDCPFPTQTSLYGASKVAGEALVTAYEHTFGFQGVILRLCSQLGSGCTRGHVVELWRQLQAHPDHLKVLGNGLQFKAYMHVADTITAMDLLLAKDARGIFNVAAESWRVCDTVYLMQQVAGMNFRVEYGDEPRGWVGDAPHIQPDTSKLQALGWRPTHTARMAVLETLTWLQRIGHYAYADPAAAH